MRTWCLVLLVAAACQKEAAQQPEFRASCKPDATFDNMTCTVDNIGKRPGRACVTAREQVPKARPLIAQRVCTKQLAPGESLTFKPKFENVTTLQPVCAPEGTWICRDEIVETPAMLTQNLPAEAVKK
jgi:hypothetical protein